MRRHDAAARAVRRDVCRGRRRSRPKLQAPQHLRLVPLRKRPDEPAFVHRVVRKDR